MPSEGHRRGAAARRRIQGRCPPALLQHATAHKSRLICRHFVVSILQMMANSTEASWCIAFRHPKADMDHNTWLMFDKEPIKASISFFECDALRLFQPTTLLLPPLI